jgi:diacylglycerol kinase (CTP)
MKRIAEVKLNSFFTGGLPVRLHLRQDLHLARKVWHMFMGLFIVSLYEFSGMSRTTAVTLLGSALGIALFVETARLRIPAFNEKVLRLWGPVMRSCEVDRMSGIPFYLLATVLAFAIFPKPVALLSVLYLAIGDPIASVFGVLYGKHSPKIAEGKSIIGTAAGVVTCMFVTLIFLKVYPVPVSDGAWLALSFVGGLSGGLAELAPFDMDDNFTIPMISGFVMWLAFIGLGL